MKNNKLFYFFTIATLYVFLVVPSHALASINSGFIPGQIWYSNKVLEEGNMVNIHTAVWNGEKGTLTAKVEFYDKNVILGSRDIVVSSLELKDVYIPWKITAGDHSISAKIISSISTVSGKKESIKLDRVTTSSDKQFVSTVVKDSNGNPISKTDTLLKDQIDKTSVEINKIVPEKVSSTISGGISSLDGFRDKTYTQISIIKDETQKGINKLNGIIEINGQIVNQKVNTEDATQKPIAYIKLFLFSILAFIFGNKIVFYGFLIAIVFYILRFIYRKIRNR